MARKKRPTRYVRNYAPGAKVKVMITPELRRHLTPSLVPVFREPYGHEWNWSEAEGQAKCRWCGASRKSDRKPCLSERRRPGPDRER